MPRQAHAYRSGRRLPAAKPSRPMGRMHHIDIGPSNTYLGVGQIASDGNPNATVTGTPTISTGAIPAWDFTSGQNISFPSANRTATWTAFTWAAFFKTTKPSVGNIYYPGSNFSGATGGVGRRLNETTNNVLVNQDDASSMNLSTVIPAHTWGEWDFWGASWFPSKQVLHTVDKFGTLYTQSTAAFGPEAMEPSTAALVHPRVGTWGNTFSLGEHEFHGHAMTAAYMLGFFNKHRHKYGL